MPADRNARMELGIRISQWLWSAGVVVTILILVLLVSGAIEGRNRIRLEQVIFATWTLGPPSWFILQNYLWPPAPDGYQRFVAQQALLKSVWAGMAAFIAAIAFGRWG